MAVRVGRDAGDLTQTKSLLDTLWAQYPIGDPIWWSLPSQPFGLNLGTPPCYYALRMLSDLTDWRLDNPLQPPPPRTATLTIVVVGQTSGIQPTTTEELNAGTGVPVTLTIDERLDDNVYAVFNESLELFSEYVEVITQGRLALNYQVLALPELDLPSTASASPAARRAASRLTRSSVASMPSSAASSRYSRHRVLAWSRSSSSSARLAR